jgi:SAM-dependent methyltransferase
VSLPVGDASRRERGGFHRALAVRSGRPSRSVDAVDINLRFLTDVPANVAVRQLDFTSDPLEVGAYDLVHCLNVLQHVKDPAGGLRRLAGAVHPGGFLLAEENDSGLFTFFGRPGNDRATELYQSMTPKLSAAGLLDQNVGRRLPGPVLALGLEDLDVGRCGEVLEGLDAIRAKLAPAFSIFTGFGVDWTSRLVDADGRYALEWTMRGTRTGVLGDLAPTGRTWPCEAPRLGGSQGI